ncbi:hypothetical protein evm_007257 [Chilo suppressalis]|nr:hypothetical protein evm_007257 [Chilo suppressalis]
MPNLASMYSEPCLCTTEVSSAALTREATACTRVAAIPAPAAADPAAHSLDLVVRPRVDCAQELPNSSKITEENICFIVSFSIFVLLAAVTAYGFFSELHCMSTHVLSREFIVGWFVFE